MNRLLLYCAVLSFIICFNGCVKEPQLYRIDTYEWIQTQIYDFEGDSFIYVRPQNPEEVYKIVCEIWKAKGTSSMTISKGSQVLLNCSVSELRYALGTESENNCLLNGYCWDTECGQTLCFSFAGTYNGLNQVEFFQFPYLTGEFTVNCHSSSLFVWHYKQF